MRFLQRVVGEMFGQETIEFASMGKLVRDTPENELIAILQDRLKNRLFPELPDLLVRPYIEAAKQYNAPVDMFEKLITIVAPQAVMEGKTAQEMPAGVRWSDSSNMNILYLHEDYTGSVERLADIVVHELGHIFTGYKNYMCRTNPDSEQRIMLGVPQPYSSSIDEGFSEYVRMKFSTEPDIFPGLDKEPEYRQPNLLQWADVESFGKDRFILPILDKQGDEGKEMGYQATPSILYYANAKGRYENLIQNYNRLNRTRDADPFNWELINQLEESINNVFVD